MTHTEKREYLIKTLLSEQPRYRDITVPADEYAQKNLLRSLMNIRTPAPLGDEYCRIESEYLREETAAKGITRITDLHPVEDGLYLWQGAARNGACRQNVQPDRDHRQCRGQG